MKRVELLCIGCWGGVGWTMVVVAGQPVIILDDGAVDQALHQQQVVEAMQLF